MAAPLIDLPPAEVRLALVQPACAGELVTRIEVHRHKPSPRNAAERAVAATAGAIQLVEEGTDATVIRAYVRLREGARCVEQDRRDSERMLRALPFVSSAAVTALPDGAGRVRVRVDIVAELPWIVGARIRDGGLSAVRFGTLDYDGRGLRTEITLERRAALRPGMGVSFAQYGAFGRPAAAELQLERRPLGGLMRASLTEPFLSDGQVTAARVSLMQDVDYVTLLRPAGPSGLARTRRSAYQLGWVRRVAASRDRRILGIAGLTVLGTDVRSGGRVEAVSDSGLVDTGDSVLVGRFPEYGVGRIGALFGVRSLRFRTVERFDALRAAQDVGTGVQFDLVAAPSVWRGERSRDLLLSAGVYAGAGRAREFAALDLRVEARAPTSGTGEWNGIIASGRGAWHTITSARRTRVLSVSGASLQRLSLPAQLTLRDPDGGLIGHPGSRAAGGHRLVVRAEERRLTDWFSRRADIAVAAFVDAGRVWAGDAPYGADSPVRSSVGLSLLGALPSGGKRVYRVDVGLPLNAERGASGVALRFTVTDRTALVWQEPHEVSRVRSLTDRSSLLRW